MYQRLKKTGPKKFSSYGVLERSFDVERETVLQEIGEGGHDTMSYAILSRLACLLLIGIDFCPKISRRFQTLSSRLSPEGRTENSPAL